MLGDICLLNSGVGLRFVEGAGSGQSVGKHDHNPNTVRTFHRVGFKDLVSHLNAVLHIRTAVGA